jgi:hypothetical protein
MIKRFHVLYVGQIDLDNVGLNGTPANDRRYSSQRLSEVFATVRDVSQTMDELGYHALWMAEHHFQREGYECLPNLVQLGLWLATQTKHLKFGCAFNVLPMWHPIRLAEDYDLSPKFHPFESRIRSSFGPVRPGVATGRGAKPPVERSAPACCGTEAFLAA